MYRPKLIVGFKTFNDGDLLKKVNHIVISLTGNTNFPSLNPTLVVVQAALNAYTQAVNNLQRFNPNTYTVRNEKREALIKLLKDLAMNLELTANGSIEMLQTTGYDLDKKPQRIGELPKTYIKQLVQGATTGSLKVVFEPVPKRTSYLIEVTTAPVTKESSWVAIISTRSEVQISSLVQGREYAVRVCAVGSNPARNYSDTAYSYVA